MTRLVLLRHGDVGCAPSLLGRTDAGLSAMGMAQAGAVRVPAGIIRVISSPLSRAIQTAELVTSAHEIEIDMRWREYDFGAFDGLPLSELADSPETKPLLDRFYDAPHTNPIPGSEAWEAFGSRMRAAVRDVVARGEAALVSTHAGVMRMVLAECCGLNFRTTWSLKVGHGCLLELRVGETGGKLWGEILGLEQNAHQREQML